MAKKILNIIESAYRAIAEEQDDTIIWINSVLKKNGGDIRVLLRGNAVNYIVKEQKAPSLSFGSWEQTNPPNIAHDMKRLLETGSEVFYVEEDAAERGIGKESIMDGISCISRSGIAKVMVECDLVWHW